MRKLLKVFKDKIYCTQGSYVFLVLFLYCACLAFYYTFYSFLSSSFAPSPVTEMDIRYSTNTTATQSSWNFWDFLLPVHQLFQHGAVFGVPLRGKFAPVLILMGPSCAVLIA